MPASVSTFSDHSTTGGTLNHRTSAGKRGEFRRLSFGWWNPKSIVIVNGIEHGVVDGGGNHLAIVFRILFRLGEFHGCRVVRARFAERNRSRRTTSRTPASFASRRGQSPESAPTLFAFKSNHWPGPFQGPARLEGPTNSIVRTSTAASAAGLSAATRWWLVDGWLKNDFHVALGTQIDC